MSAADSIHGKRALVVGNVQSADCFRHHSLLYQAALTSAKCGNLAGESSGPKMAPLRHTLAQEPQPMHRFGLMWSCFASAKPGSSSAGWIAFLTQAAMQRMSLMHRSLTTNARVMVTIFQLRRRGADLRSQDAPDARENRRVPGRCARLRPGRRHRLTYLKHRAWFVRCDANHIPCNDFAA